MVSFDRRIDDYLRHRWTRGQLTAQITPICTAASAAIVAKGAVQNGGSARVIPETTLHPATNGGLRRRGGTKDPPDVDLIGYWIFGFTLSDEESSLA